MKTFRTWKGKKYLHINSVTHKEGVLIFLALIFVMINLELNVGSTREPLAFAAVSGGGGSGGSVCCITPDPTLPVVTASPPGGKFNAVQSITLTGKATTYTIYYTTDGSTPTTSSTVYSTPISITTTTTLKFFAKDTVGNVSPTIAQTYTIDTIAPTVSATPAGGTYNLAQSVTLSASEASTIYYTTDGTPPTTSSSVYSSPISVSSNTDLKFFAKDTVGNAGTVASQAYTIDTIPPEITIPSSPVTATTTSSSGAVVNFQASASDNVDGPVQVTCDHPSGSTFPLGNTLVKCKATDKAGNTAEEKTFTVTVMGNDTTEDTNKPEIKVPSEPVTATVINESGATVTFPVSATDDLDGTVPVTCTPASGSTFPLGETVVKCNARDKAGNPAEASFKVTVTSKDVTKPEIRLSEPLVPIELPPGETGSVVNYEVTATDDIDGQIAAKCTPPPGSTFKVGDTTVECIATDKAGNTATEKLVIKVASSGTPPEEPKVVSPEPRGIDMTTWIIIGGVVAAAAVGGIVIMKAKSKKKDDIIP